MLVYIIRRIIIFIPTLVVITLLGFIISINAPGDPVERMTVASQTGEMGTQTINQIEQKKFWKKKLGLDLPVFYFALSSFGKPDTLYRIYNENEREALERLVDKYGNWTEIEKHYRALDRFYNSLLLFKPDSSLSKRYNKNELTEVINEVKFEALALKSSYEHNMITAKLDKLKKLIQHYPFLWLFKNEIDGIAQNYLSIRNNKISWKKYFPKLVFYKRNQYHRWIFGDGHWLTGKDSQFSKGIIRGDFGTSYVTKQPISEVIESKIGWSLFFSLISVFLAYFISIPIGVKAAATRGSKFDKTSSLLLFMLYSLPSFWMATLLLMTFANPDVFHIFPASGVKPSVGYPDDASLLDKIKLSLPYLILPTICYTYSSFAFLSRTMRVSMLETLSQDYIRTATAKGLSHTIVIWKHAFKNSLLPIITVFANIFPLAIGGSVILETIFTIPGMGSESIFAIQNQDYPMIIAILTITGILTMVGYLVSDILYAMVDPRISFLTK